MLDSPGQGAPADRSPLPMNTKTASAIIAGCLLIGCGASHRLAEYSFRELTAAATVSAPPAVRITTDMQAGVYPDDPIGSAIRMGTAIAKHAQVAATAARLDSALAGANLPERIRLRILSRSADYLQYRPVDTAREADLLFDIRILQYGMRAESWRSHLVFNLELAVLLMDVKRGTVIWEREVREHMPVASSVFGLGGPVGDIVTAVRLSNLSTEELAEGLFHLSDYTADMVINRLRNDYLESHSP